MEDMTLQQPELIGREEELNQLKRHLEEAIAGKGSTILISGEAGIGKTRLIEEFRKFSATQNVKIRSGITVTDTIHPFLIFSKALESEIDRPLFHEEEYTSFTEIFAVNKAGLLVAQASSEEDELDADIFAGMLSAVQDFIRDSFDSTGEHRAGLGKLEYGDMKILIEHGRQLFLTAVFSGTEHPDMKNMLKRTLDEIEERHGNVLESWSGKMADVASVQKDISSLAGARFLVRRDLEGIKLDNERIRIADQVLEIFRESSLSRPLVLFLEDLHWADESSLFVLNYLARNIREEKIMIVGTMRPKESISLQETVAKMKDEGTLDETILEKLGKEDVISLVNKKYVPNEFPQMFVDQLASQCEGNPFFVIEVLNQMQEEGNITKDDGRYILVSEDFNIPTTVEDVVQHRLDNLDPETMAIAEYSSCIGREFERDAVLSFWALKDVASAFEKLQNAGIVTGNNGTAEFSHAIFHDVIYKGIGERWKSSHHKSLGEYYEIRYKNRINEVLYELARHFSRSNEHQKAFDYCFRAGEKAESAFAAEQAIEFYENVLVRLPSIRTSKNDTVKEEVKERLADIFMFTGNYDKSLEYYDSTMAGIPDAASKARIYRKRAGTLEKMSEYEKALSEIAEAEPLLDENAKERWKLVLLRAFILMRTGEYKESISSSTRAIDELRKLGDCEKEVGDAYNNLGGCNYLIGKYEEAHGYYEESLEIAEKGGTKREIATALNNIGMVLKSKGKLEESRDFQKKSLSIREEIGDLYGIAASCNNIGSVYAAMGDLAKGLEYCEKCLDVCVKTGNQWGIGTAHNSISSNLLTKGELDRALEHSKKSLEIEEKIGDQYGVSCSYGNLGTISLERGEPDQAEVWYNKCLTLCQKLGAKDFIVEAELGLAQTYVELGKFEMAFENANDAISISVDNGDIIKEGGGHRVLGMIYREKKELDKATEEFEKARAILEEVGDKKELARFLYEYGLLFKAKYEADRAKEYLEKSLSIFEKMGMKLWEEKCKKAMAELE